MKVLVIGSGGREHAIAWKLRQSRRLSELYCAPGNAGTAGLGVNVPIHAEDIDRLRHFAEEQAIDLTVVGPEAPLTAGIVDAFQQAGLRIVGPTRQAAQLEGSKAFAKDFMARHGIPTAAYEVFCEPSLAEECLHQGRFGFPVVVKADGLAAGKGVFICPDLAAGLQAVDAVMRERRFGGSGDRVVIEECLVGEEASFMVFSDGREILPMAASQDHKAVYDGDRGPNTGGMGAYSTDFILSGPLRERVLDQIIRPTIQGMAAEGSPYQGILYAGLMLTAEGPKTLEFNVRFGDPETQAVLPRLRGDLLEVLDAVASVRLNKVAAKWSSDAAVCVVMASGGYPGAYEKGKTIVGLDLAAELAEVVVFHAGTAVRDNRIVTEGGRVLGVTAQAPSLEEAILRAYEGVNRIHFDGVYFRRDIAAKGLRKSRDS